MPEREVPRTKINDVLWGAVTLPEHGKIHNAALKGLGAVSGSAGTSLIDASSSTTDPRLARLMGASLVVAGAVSFAIATAESVASHKRRLSIPEITSVNTVHEEDLAPKIATIQEFIRKAKLVTKKGSRNYRRFRVEARNATATLYVYTGLSSKYDHVQLTVREQPIKIEGEEVRSVKSVLLDVENGVALVKIKNGIESSRRAIDAKERETSLRQDELLSGLDESLEHGSQQELQEALDVLSLIIPEGEIVDYNDRTKNKVDRDKKAGRVIRRKVDNLLAIATEEGCLSELSGVQSADFDVNGRSIHISKIDSKQKGKKKGFYSITIAQIAGQEAGPFPTEEFILHGKDLLKYKTFEGVDPYYSSISEVYKGDRSAEEMTDYYLRGIGFFEDTGIPSDEQVQDLLTTLSSLGVSSMRRH